MSQSPCCARAGVAKRISNAKQLSATLTDLYPIKFTVISPLLTDQIVVQSTSEEESERHKVIDVSRTAIEGA
jgi:hypothetical protein